jgi:MoaA/NifB/PqqE/SkfB family radical SAM enzyme
MTLKDIERILGEARDLGTVEWIYFEGGEPFLYYAVMLRGVQMAAEAGFRVGIVTNGYWANSREDTLQALRPLAGLVQDLSVSADPYHGGEEQQAQAVRVREAAQELGIPVGTISIDDPTCADADPVTGQLPAGLSPVQFRGRAAVELASKAEPHPWQSFTKCVPEDLERTSRVHIDPLGYVHICQGISIGNVFTTSLARICREYDPGTHPITGPLLAGGPAELVRRYGLEAKEGYADGCHLCYEARKALRSRFPEILTPDPMYGQEEATP